jgi:hypothetical protein
MVAGAPDTKCHRIDGLRLVIEWPMPCQKSPVTSSFDENKGLAPLLWEVPFGAQSAVE